MKNKNALDDFPLPGNRDSFRSVICIEFLKDVYDMPLNRANADDQLRGDFFIGTTIGDQA